VSDGSAPAATHPFADRALPPWYDDAKFGIFIHWGPYSVPCYAPVDRDMGDLFAAGDWAEVFRWSPYTEWYLNSWALEGSPTAEHHRSVYGDRDYGSFVDEFRDRSVGADPDTWAELFRAAGARYVVPVTKHHDGYLMWPSRTPNPFRDRWSSERDVIGDLAAAVRSSGLRFGLYYSGGLDWTFVAPGIDSFPAMVANIPRTPEYAEYVTAHVDELVDLHRPSVLWNDIAWPRLLDPNDTFARYYERVPDGIVNDRFDVLAVRAGTLHADVTTPEYSTVPHGDRKWEVCRGIGRSFGYNRMEDESTLASVDDLVWMLVDIVGRGGNLLLNVGPTADGQIPLAQAARLTALGWWLRVNGEAIHDTRPFAGGVSGTDDGRSVRMTTRGAAGGERTVYVLVEGAPAGTVRIAGLSPATGAEVRMLGSPRRLAYHVDEQALAVDLPDHLPASPATVIAIDGY
jgi:alpha-L-fucosidase